MNLLTVFTPTYNRKHTIVRTYESLKRQTCKDFQWLIIDDGSTDGTRELVLSWVENGKESKEGKECIERPEQFDWMGRPLDVELRDESLELRENSGNTLTSNQAKRLTSNHFIIEANGLQIEYIYKPNGGLYTGYNVAYATIETELCVCIDSDDFMPDDAVEKIVNIWNSISLDERLKIGGIAGLDYDVTNGKPLGGLFPVDNQVAWIQDLHHPADSKYVFRTAEIKRYAPQIGFEGERDYNPHYMQIRLFDEYPMFVVNKNFCWVEYQIGLDSMSQGIWKQYVRSPKSYAKYRINQMTLKHGNPLKNKFRLCVHYVSSCILSKDKDWLKNSPLKLLTILAAPFGGVLTFVIKHKARI